MSAWPVTIALPKGLTVGGVTTWAVNLARALAESGCDARLVAHASDEGYAQVDSSYVGPSVRLIQAPPLTEPDGWRESLAIYRDLLPTIMLPNLLAESYAVAAALALVHSEKLRVVGWNHSDNPYDYAHLTCYEPIIQTFVAVSRRCHDELAQRMPHRLDAIEHAPYGVFVPDERPRPPLADRPIRLIYAGRMEQTGKRVLGFVDLAKILDRRGLQFELRLVGDGPQEGDLRRLCDMDNRELTIAGNRIWLEPPVPHDRMSEIWAWADASLLNSNREGFSVSMIESMACGCVPIVSRVESGVDDIIEERRTGLTFRTDDLEALADRIEWLARDEIEMREISRAARQAAERCSGYPRYFQRVSGILSDVAKSPARHWPVDRPLHASSTDSGGGMTVPADADERLRHLLRRIAQSGGGPIAIYGAGRHTRALASVWAEFSVEIVAVIDDDYGLHGSQLWGWPIVAPEAASDTGAATIVVSSWLHEDAILRRFGDYCESAGLNLLGIYGETQLPAAAVPT